MHIKNIYVNIYMCMNSYRWIHIYINTFVNNIKCYNPIVTALFKY